MNRTFHYAADPRLVAFWGPFGVRPGTDGVRLTDDDYVVMASEVGVLDIPAEDIVLKERLHPGRIFLVDTARGRIVSDEEVKRELAPRTAGWRD